MRPENRAVVARIEAAERRRRAAEVRAATEAGGSLDVEPPVLVALDDLEQRGGGEARPT